MLDDENSKPEDNKKEDLKKEVLLTPMVAQECHLLQEQCCFFLQFLE
jgi:hypothetical protein